MDTQASPFTGRTFTDEGPFPAWMVAEQSSFDRSAADAVFWVVRTRQGKFVRAFIHEYQAWRWVKDSARWRYAPETMRARAADGSVFDVYRTV